MSKALKFWALLYIAGGVSCVHGMESKSSQEVLDGIGLEAKYAGENGGDIKMLQCLRGKLQKLDCTSLPLKNASTKLQLDLLVHFVKSKNRLLNQIRYPYSEKHVAVDEDKIRKILPVDVPIEEPDYAWALPSSTESVVVLNKELKEKFKSKELKGLLHHLNWILGDGNREKFESIESLDLNLPTYGVNTEDLRKKLTKVDDAWKTNNPGLYQKIIYGILEPYVDLAFDQIVINITKILDRNIERNEIIELKKLKETDVSLDAGYADYAAYFINKPDRQDDSSGINFRKNAIYFYNINI